MLYKKFYLMLMYHLKEQIYELKNRVKPLFTLFTSFARDLQGFSKRLQEICKETA